MFKPFLTAYQTDRPMISFLYGDLVKLLKNIFSVIIKPNIMNKCETALKLKEIDLFSSANHLIAKEIDTGFVAFTHIVELRRRDEVSKTWVLAFKKANALKRTRDKTDDEIKTLQKTLVSLEDMRSKI